MMKLEENLRSLSMMNEKLQEDTTRLRRERDYYKNEASKLNVQLKTAESPKMEQSNYLSDNSVLYRFKEENETLQN